MTVDIGSGLPKRLSLKSTAAKNLSKTTAHISKLTEAAWIQDTRTAIPSRYQLLEVPVTIFSSVQGAPLSDFQSDAPVISCRSADDTVLARVALDRSDPKVTIRSIRLASCVLHAEWIRP